MLYIVTALHWEAKPLIDHYGLKKKVEIAPFEVFESDELTLIVSGIGRLNAAAATSFLLSDIAHGRAAMPSLFLNFGVCGSASQDDVGALFLANRIVDRPTNNSFVPEMLVRSTLPERTLETSDLAITDSKDLLQEGHLADMEAFAVCETAGKFLPVELIQCLKIPSDALVCGTLSQEYVGELVWERISEISLFVSQYRKEQLQKEYQDYVLSEDEERMLKDLGTSLRLTMNQRRSLQERAKAYKIQSAEDISFLKRFAGKSPVSKSNVKQIYKQILHELTAT